MRLCATCEEPISSKRLAAVPDARQCVQCLEQAGDVPMLKRRDEYYGTEGENCDQTYYTSNQYFDTPRKRDTFRLHDEETPFGDEWKAVTSTSNTGDAAPDPQKEVQEVGTLARAA